MDELSANVSLVPLPQHHGVPPHAWVIYIILTLPNLALPIASNVQYGGRSSFHRSAAATTAYRVLGVSISAVLDSFQEIQFWLVCGVLSCVLYCIPQGFLVDALIMIRGIIFLLWSLVVYLPQAYPSQQQSRAMRMREIQTLPLGPHPPQWESFITSSNTCKPPPSSSQMPSPMLADYLLRRDKLIAEDRALRIDRVRANYSAAELKADQVVRSIRAKENISVWGVDHEHVPHPYPGMEFLNGMGFDLRLALPLTYAYSQRNYCEDRSLQ
jgi:hypothetical protein